MGFLDYFKRKNAVSSKENKGTEQKREPELYSQEEQEQVEAYVGQAFGPFQEVFHEIYSQDIRVDVAVIPPASESDYYKLVTMGMGAHKMAVPEKFRLYGLDRAELVLFLPKEWKIKSDEEIWRWPVQCLKACARWPVRNHEWVGIGQVIRPGYVPNTESARNEFRGFLLQHAVTVPGVRSELELKEDVFVQFYQMIPLYEEEADLIQKTGDPNQILSRFDEKDRRYLIDGKRTNYGIS
ncbi:MAG: suppressor of fused domain protein [Fusicatenibacter sp.]|nr:suppressor of fused domain protein [Lachnospiraceae bacterium]MDY2938988.1 suppressor of fused domain protein [Fusicatenibacter sp.]